MQKKRITEKDEQKYIKGVCDALMRYTSFEIFLVVRYLLKFCFEYLKNEKMTHIDLKVLF